MLSFAAISHFCVDDPTALSQQNVGPKIEPVFNQVQSFIQRVAYFQFRMRYIYVANFLGVANLW